MTYLLWFVFLYLYLSGVVPLPLTNGSSRAKETR